MRPVRGEAELSADNSDPGISVAGIGNGEFLVAVSGPRKTEHRVTVTADHLHRYAPDGVSVDTLLRESFRFLLEREPNTSILSRFELSVIERYFPEYREEIRRRLELADGER